MHGEEVAEYYTTTETLSSPDTKLDYFVGDISTARCYAFWVEKDYNNVDISYFQYCPYDLGKTVLGTEFGNHVSDWEHITIRFAKFTYNGVDYLKPIQVKYPSHNFAYDYTWAEVTKVDNTHPVAYSALGSHGMWKDTGSYVYKNIVVAQLTDVCTAGSAWDTWNCLETYEYSAQTRTGRGMGTTEWKSYVDVDYAPTLAAYLKQKGKVQQRLIAYLRSIPTYLDIEVAGKRFYMVHGFPGDNVHDEVWTRPTMESENPIPDCRLIIGHTKVLSLIQPEEKRINHALDLESRGERLNILHAPGFINLDCGCGYDMPIKALACLRLEDFQEFYI
jgi:hypothetical protein